MVARPRKWYEVAEKVVDSVEEERKAEMTPAQSALLDKYRHLLRRGFRGAYVHGLDTKGRMIVPASFRQALGDRFYICMTPDFKAIAIYPQHEWELYYCSLLELAEKDMPYMIPKFMVFAARRWSGVTISGKIPKILAAVSLWTSSPDRNAPRRFSSNS